MDLGDRTRGRYFASLAELRREFVRLMEESDRRGAQRLLREALAAGYDAMTLLREVVNPAVETVAQSWTGRHELSLSQIYVAGLIVDDSVALLAPPEGAQKPVAKIVFGVAEGDHHGLGKRIVSAFLRSAGFEVIDLGLSVPAEKFVEAALQEGAKIIAVSTLMLAPAFGIRRIREELQRRGAEHIKLLVGGAPFRYSPELYKIVGADATAASALDAIAVAKRLVEADDEQE